MFNGIFITLFLKYVAFYTKGYFIEYQNDCKHLSLGMTFLYLYSILVCVISNLPHCSCTCILSAQMHKKGCTQTLMSYLSQVLDKV